MEVGTEISQKIRSAIKAKLIELGAYVDDELPDYIMVMVANKKSREQMISDLNLFLGKNTDTFAEWLHGLLGKLQTISVDSNADKDAKEKKKSDSKKEKKVKKSSKSESLQGKKVRSKKSADTKTDKTVDSKSIGEKTKQDKENSQHDGNKEKGTSQSDSTEIEDVRQMLVTVAPTDELAAELETTEARIQQSHQEASQAGKTQCSESDRDTGSDTRNATVRRKRSASPASERRSVQSSSAPKKHRGLISVVANVSKDEEEEEYDPLCPAVGSVASVVKVTSRKSKIPPALQANRALLVKAMGEAERSIAIKRQIVAPRSTDREDSPSEVYTPKRKKSSGGLEPSPPPYIPSRKEGSSVGLRASSSSSSSHREVDHRRGGHHADSRSEHARQTLSSQDRRDLISRSRRMELFKHIGIDRKEEPVSHGSGSHSRNVRQSPRKMDSRKVEDCNQRRGNSSSLGSIRQVSGRRRDNDNDDGVKDLKIKARLGPVVRTTLSESSKGLETEDGSGEGQFDLRNKMTRSSNSKDDTIQIIVNPSRPPALKGSIASRLGKIVVKRDELDDDGFQGNSHIRGETVGKGRMAISTHAKSLVNKQCREAVLSVSATGRKLRKSVSPDSRCFEDADDDDDEEEEEEADEDEEEEDAGNKREENMRIGRITEGKSVSITVKQTVMKEESKKDKNKEVDDDDRNDNINTSEKVVEDEEGEPEDLAEMIGEKLEPELLNDTVQDELNLDAEVNAEDVDDIETMIGVKSETDKPKPGTRFIVTLDGVDERQLYSESSGNDGKSMDLPPYIRPPQTMVVDPSKKLSPSIAAYAPQLTQLPPLPPSAQQMVPSVGIPVQSNIGQSTTISSGALPHTPFPPVQFNLGEPHPLPPISAGIIRNEPQINKPLPPKIQPFSINLKDSDDEFEDKESRMQISPSASGGYINNTSLTSLTALQKAKMSERCKFWPACAAGSECEFHHPTSYCKTFPNCKFADKCLFIHPNCKFDSKCTRQDCPFTHISRRPGLSSLSSSAPSSVPTIPFHPPKAPAPVPSRTATVCRFFPNCHNPTCLFLHPKPCRFGAACQNTSCLFYHPAPAVIVPTKDKLTWKAQTVTTHVKDITPTSSSSSLSMADPAAKFRQPVAKVSPMNSTTNS